MGGGGVFICRYVLRVYPYVPLCIRTSLSLCCVSGCVMERDRDFAGGGFGRGLPRGQDEEKERDLGWLVGGYHRIYLRAAATRGPSSSFLSGLNSI